LNFAVCRKYLHGQPYRIFCKTLTITRLFMATAKLLADGASDTGAAAAANLNSATAPLLHGGNGHSDDASSRADSTSFLQARSASASMSGNGNGHDRSVSATPVSLHALPPEGAVSPAPSAAAAGVPYLALTGDEPAVRVAPPRKFPDEIKRWRSVSRSVVAPAPASAPVVASVMSASSSSSASVTSTTTTSSSVAAAAVSPTAIAAGEKSPRSGSPSKHANGDEKKQEKKDGRNFATIYTTRPLEVKVDEAKEKKSPAKDDAKEVDAKAAAEKLAQERSIYVTRPSTPSNDIKDAKIEYGVHAGSKTTMPLIPRSNDFVYAVAYATAAGSLVTEFLFAGFTIKYTADGTNQLTKAFGLGEAPYFAFPLPLGILLGSLDLAVNLSMFTPGEEAKGLSQQLPDGFAAGFRSFAQHMLANMVTVGIPAAAMSINFPAGGWADNDPIIEQLKAWLTTPGAWAIAGPVLYLAVAYYVFFSGADVLNSIKFFLQQEGINQDYLWDLLAKGEFSTPYQVFIEAFSQHFIRSFLFGGLAQGFAETAGLGSGAQAALYWLSTAATGLISILTRHRRVYEHWLGNRAQRLDLVDDAERDIIWKDTSWREYFGRRAKDVPVSAVQTGTQGYFTHLAATRLFNVSSPVAMGVAVASGVAGYAGRWRADVKRDLSERFLDMSQRAYQFKAPASAPSAATSKHEDARSDEPVRVTVDPAKYAPLTKKQGECKREVGRIKATISSALVGQLNRKVDQIRGQLHRSLVTPGGAAQLEKMATSIEALATNLFDAREALRHTWEQLHDKEQRLLVLDATQRSQKKNLKKILKRLEQQKNDLIRKVESLKTQLTILIEVHNALTQIRDNTSREGTDLSIELTNLIALLSYLYDPSYRRNFTVNGVEQDVLPNFSPNAFKAELAALRQLESRFSTIQDLDLDALIAYLTDHRPTDIDCVTEIARLRELRRDLVSTYMTAVPKAQREQEREEEKAKMDATLFQTVANVGSQAARAVTGAAFAPNLVGGFGASALTGVSNFRYFKPKLQKCMPDAGEAAKDYAKRGGSAVANFLYDWTIGWSRPAKEAQHHQVPTPELDATPSHQPVRNALS
jgi:hypothetical protein